MGIRPCWLSFPQLEPVKASPLVELPALRFAHWLRKNGSGKKAVEHFALARHNGPVCSQEFCFRVVSGINGICQDALM